MRSCSSTYFNWHVWTITTPVCGWLWLWSELHRVDRTSTVNFVLTPSLRISACTPHLISVDSSPLYSPPCHNTSLPERSTQQLPVNTTAKSPAQYVDVNRRWLSTVTSGGSVLDELKSWRRLNEPLERYLEFVRCNYFGDDNQPTAAAEGRLEDDSCWVAGLLSSSRWLHYEQNAAAGRRRPKEEPVHIASRYHLLSEQRASGNTSTDLMRLISYLRSPSTPHAPHSEFCMILRQQ